MSMVCESCSSATAVPVRRGISSRSRAGLAQPGRALTTRRRESIRILFLVLLAGAFGHHSSVAPGPAAATPRALQLPLSFEENQGQADRQVKFLARGGGYDVFVTPAATVLAVAR